VPLVYGRGFRVSSVRNEEGLCEGVRDSLKGGTKSPKKLSSAIAEARGRGVEIKKKGGGRQNAPGKEDLRNTPKKNEGDSATSKR